MTLVGKKMISGERFVVELQSGCNCRESDLKRLIYDCSGSLKLRQLTAEDRFDQTAEDLPQPKRHQDEKADRLALLLKQLLTELMD